MLCGAVIHVFTFHLNASVQGFGVNFVHSRALSQFKRGALGRKTVLSSTAMLVQQFAIAASCQSSSCRRRCAPLRTANYSD
jgi:hypothetical protein